MDKKRNRIEIKGQVQGVGFRPFVYRSAIERALTGWVLNTSEGVSIEIEGESGKVDDFIRILKKMPPSQAVITGFDSHEIPLQQDKSFKIADSIEGGIIRTFISPDIATCPECQKELLDRADRRFHYPFLNCTSCGPRLSIVKSIPYDRKNSTMDIFTMCPECSAEYNDPANRRFHAQPNCCPKCGPEFELIDKKRSGSNDAVNETINELRKGRIGAIKGIGGFHLACDAFNDRAVLNLRNRKYREEKPFALMAKDIETIRNFCFVSKQEEELLLSFRRPIVLLKKKNNSGKISKYVAPNNNYLGFMLPYAPLHYLLFSDTELQVLVMTSGNAADEPIVYENGKVHEVLSKIADFFLLHNRDIHIRCDDSVTRIIPSTGIEMLLRRSRGYVPQPIKLNFNFKNEILSCGAHLKNSFCMARDDDVFLSHHIGDLDNWETLKSFEKGIEHFQNLFDIKPRLIACDMHPEYLSTKFAEEYVQKNPDIKLIKVQHHHAHIVSCMADNGIQSRKVIGVAFDGTGYGNDGNIWGAEFLVADYKDFERRAYFKYIPMPGGEQAIKEPWRIAVSYLYKVYGMDLVKSGLAVVKRQDKKELKIICRMLENRMNAPLASSCGRLFDAVASLVGIKDSINYEGQAAIELERAIRDDIPISDESYDFKSDLIDNVYIIYPELIIKGVIGDLKKHISTGIISMRFHNSVSEIIVDTVSKLRNETGLDEVFLSGGVFQNMFLLNRVVGKLKERKFKVFHHSRIPTNDAGICVGQTLIANARCK